MPLDFRNVRAALDGLQVELNLSFLDGLMVGLTGPNGAGKSAFLRIAAAEVQPLSGEVCGLTSGSLAAASLESADPKTIRESVDQAFESGSNILLVGPSFALTDPVYQQQALLRFHALRRKGGIVVLASHDLALLERHCDEVVVMEHGRVQDRGDARQTVADYRRRLVENLRHNPPRAELEPQSRHGDERAVIREVGILGSDGQPTSVLRSGEQTTVRVRFTCQEALDEPVIGILIRGRIGINVYGTNTELEDVKLGPCRAGDELEVCFAFECNLCAEQYTLTVAVHDPEGTAHEWLEEALMFTVTDTRYTAGVANLRARVEAKR